MSQHSQRTQFGPPMISIVVAGAMVALSSAGTAYMVAGPGIGPRKVVACALGLVLTGFLVTYTLGLVADRAVAQDRMRRAAQRERRDRQREDSELNAWQNAAAGLLEAYLTGNAVDFGGELVPDYVRARLADLPVPTSPTYAEPMYADQPPLAPPMYPDQDVARYLGEELDPLGYQANPERPWRAFEPDRVVVPMPPREVPVSPGRGGPEWSGAETEVISRVRDEDQTQVIPAQS